MKDFYYILGTTGDASAAEIEAAYKKLARKFSDEQDAFMNAHFREITEAYDILRDERRRRKYDAAFRRSQRRHFAAFRLKYLNIALTLTFLVITALFAVYVIRNLEGRPKKVTPTPPPTPATTTAPVASKKHHKAVLAAKTVGRSDVNSIPKFPAANIVPPVKNISQPGSKASPDSTYTASLHANVTGIVYLHESPGYGSAVLAKLPDATQVHVLQKGTAWYKISYNGQEGYVIKSAIER